MPPSGTRIWSRRLWQEAYPVAARGFQMRFVAPWLTPRFRQGVCRHALDLFEARPSPGGGPPHPPVDSSGSRAPQIGDASVHEFPDVPPMGVRWPAGRAPAGYPAAHCATNPEAESGDQSVLRACIGRSEWLMQRRGQRQWPAAGNSAHRPRTGGRSAFLAEVRIPIHGCPVGGDHRGTIADPPAGVRRTPHTFHPVLRDIHRRHHPASHRYRRVWRGLVGGNHACQPLLGVGSETGEVVRIKAARPQVLQQRLYDAIADWAQRQTS